MGVNYTAVAGAHTVDSIVANQTVGNTCPYILSKAGVSIGSGLNISATAGKKFSVTMSSFIGNFANSPASVLNSNGGNTYMPCRLYIPQINYTPSYTKMILDAPIKTILYDDYYVDSVQNFTSGKYILLIYLNIDVDIQFSFLCHFV